jgi:ADP-ribosylglycohydrolase
LWCSAHNLDDFEQALWLTARGFGDVDTTCAIVGGIVALSAKEIPALWLKHREPLPS